MKDKKRSKGFTLIELIAVLVILAVIALIVTPLVLNIVRKAKDSANKRSVDAYGKSIDLAVASYLLDTGDFPTSIDQLTIEYSGKEVVCGIVKLNEDSSVYLSKCSVGGVEVKDSNNKDGYYHYGTTTTYQEYKIGDVITYNGMNFYVIENSDENSDSVTMLKAEPLTADEIDTYGVGHVNMNNYDPNDYPQYYQKAYDNGSYGGMAYYTSANCTWSSKDVSGCTNDYDVSEVKYVVDAWTVDKFQASDLKTDSIGYKTRLITIDEVKKMGYIDTVEVNSSSYRDEFITEYDWIQKYSYWTMSPSNDSQDSVIVFMQNVKTLLNFFVNYGNNNSAGDSYLGVRPVVTLYKSAL